MNSKVSCRVCRQLHEPQLVENGICSQCRASSTRVDQRPSHETSVQDLRSRETRLGQITKPKGFQLRHYYGKGEFKDFRLGEQEFRLGKGSNSDLILDEDLAAREHCLIYLENGHYYIKDLGTRHGTYLNGRRAISERLYANDRIRIGNTWLEFLELSLNGDVSQDVGGILEKLERKIRLRSQRISIGRAENNDIVLDSPLISRSHAVLTSINGDYFIQDLNTTNGTYVNAERVYGKLKLKKGDEITIGPYVLKFDGASLKEESEVLELRIDAANVGKSYGREKILDQVSCSFRSHELVGVLGPSGSGKTNLLKILAGITKPTMGGVYYNRTDLSKNLALSRKKIGYVPQDDIVYKELSTFQNFYYAAKLRLPQDTRGPEILNKVEEVLKILQLQNRRHLRVSRLSGGQRKRVNVGAELFTDPSVIFLDEPLSGLDPETAAHLLKLFRKLAQRGKAVVVSTHAMENFELYDKIAILDQGVLIYFGSPKGALEFFQVDNPARIYSCLEKRSPKKWEEDYHRTPFYYHFIVEPRLQAASKPLIAGPSPLKKLGNYLRQRVSWRASLTLMSRYLDIKLADRKANLLLLGQSVILGGILATISSGERIALILMMMVVYMGVINGLREIVRENTIFARERLVFLKIPSYLASKFFVLSIYVLFQVFIFLGIAKVFIGLPGDFNGYLITLGFCGLASLSFGLFCSVISGNSERANFMIPIALLPQVFYSGTIVRIEEMDPVNRAISTLVISRWTIYGFMENYVGHRLSEVWHQALANIYLAVFFLVVTAILLYSRRKESIE